ncbi:MAG: 30S ribosomal protein S3 [Chromatiales bacterium]|nr:30S ribosomal protein S3 [Chromatiales bacterium]
MGQKVHPTGFRVGIMTGWASKWLVAPNSYRDTLYSDIVIRNYLLNKLAHASVSRVTIDRTGKAVHVVIHTARPGIVIGKKGGDIEALRNEVAKISNLSIGNVQISIEEIRKPETDAVLVASSIALQLERRIMYRRAMKRAIQNTMRLGALGIKICISGRLNGAEIARSEWNKDGRIPLHTLDADIDYGLAEAKTTYGIIGVKVWIYKGNFSDQKEKEMI